MWKKLNNPDSLKEYARCHKAIGKEETFLTLCLVALILWLPAILIGEKIVNPFIVKNTNKKVQLVEQAIETEKKYLLKQAKEIVDSKELNPYIASNDVRRLISLTNDEKEKRNISMIGVINKDGITLSRVPLTALAGDYHFLIYPWGRVLSQGKSTATAGVGRTIPLLFVAGYPILNNGALEGAVTTVYTINDAYAKIFHDRYLPPNIQIAFYSKKEGIVGVTFTGKEENNVKKYFNSGSDFIQKNKTDFLVRHDGKYHLVKNTPLQGLENTIPGGALIFIPRYPLIEGMILSFIVAVLVLIIGIIIHRGHKKEECSFYTIYLMAIITAILFAANTAIYVLTIKDKAADLQELPQIIYNSVLKLEPEWGTVDIATEQTIAVKIISGGETINAARADIEYDPTRIKIIDIITAKSFCDPNTFIEKTVDNENGSAVIACVKPNGFNKDEAILAELVVQPLKTGNFSLHFGPETRVFANDGLGTNVLRQATGANFLVAWISNGEESNSLLLFSPSHPNEERWYNTRDISVSFLCLTQKMPRHIYALDKNPNTVIRNGQTTTENMINIKAPGDGVYYVHVAGYTAGGIGPTAHLKIKIDTVPPASPDIKASDYTPKVNEVVRFNIESSDESSGLQKTYYYKINEGVRLPLGRELAVPFQEKGAYILTARAFDNADNFSDSSVIIRVK